jgi:DNA replication protein DnaC
MIAPDQDLDALFKRLHLANARRVWRDLVQRAERDAWSYRDFLTLLVTEEIAHRQQTRLGRLTRRAHFPFLKTIDDFNFTYQSTLRLHMLGSALAADFVTEGRSLIFSGKSGRGKTHLAIAIAYRAIQNGFDAFFTTAATLIDDLSAAFREGQLAEALQAYTHPSVLVVDEVGYLTYGTDAANMLFHVVNERHRRRRSMIFTTNKALKAWGRVLHDEDLGQAIIDRVLERGRLIRLDGPSIRTLHLKLDEALKDESDQDDEVARISGIKWPEFPEPTTSRLDALRHKPLSQDTINEMVLWKVDRYVKLGKRLRDSMQALRALRPQDHRKGEQVLMRLLDCKGVDLPMASTFLRFQNADVFQIIDRRAFRALYGTRYPLSHHHHNDRKTSLYFDYLDALHALAKARGVAFRDLDRILYVFDKRKNGALLVG